MAHLDEIAEQLRLKSADVHQIWDAMLFSNKDYERIAFLGKAMLEAGVAKHLFHRRSQNLADDRLVYVSKDSFLELQSQCGFGPCTQDTEFFMHVIFGLEHSKSNSPFPDVPIFEWIDWVDKNVAQLQRKHTSSSSTERSIASTLPGTAFSRPTDIPTYTALRVAPSKDTIQSHTYTSKPESNSSSSLFDSHNYDFFSTSMHGANHSELEPGQQKVDDSFFLDIPAPSVRAEEKLDPSFRGRSVPIARPLPTSLPDDIGRRIPSASSHPNPNWQAATGTLLPLALSLDRLNDLPHCQKDAQRRRILVSCSAKRPCAQGNCSHSNPCGTQWALCYNCGVGLCIKDPKIQLPPWTVVPALARPEIDMLPKIDQCVGKPSHHVPRECSNCKYDVLAVDHCSRQHPCLFALCSRRQPCRRFTVWICLKCNVAGQLIADEY